MTSDAPSAPAGHDTPSLAFGSFELRPEERQLLRDGDPVELRAKAFDLLVVLVERAGRLVTKSDLLDLVWPGLVVEENNIASQVAALRKVVGGELVATVPGRGYRFVAEVRRSRVDSQEAALEPVEPASDARGAGAQRLFGRDDDLRRLQAQLDTAGVVTLVGPGGVGKTVLARAAMAARPAQRGAWVDLAALREGVQVAGAVCRALGVATPASAEARSAAVVAGLADGHGLLVLDNAEHLVDEVAALAAACASALPALAVLVTSQLPLRVAGERVQVLEPLALPEEGRSGEEMLASAPVQMLLERIRAGDARLAVGADALPLLRSLCARLDGLPLAIEMAASMVPLLGLGGVVAALDQRFELLRRGHREAPARHKTLLAALEWSHALLAPAQQRAFRRLAVFAGSFSLELAVAVMADAGEDRWDVIDSFSELVDRSLVASLHTDPPRYRLLETMRSFALQQLEVAPDREAQTTRARLVRALTERLARFRYGEDADVANELANVPEALEWARGHDVPAAFDLTYAAAQASTWTPWLSEAHGWVDAGEPLLDAGPTPVQQAVWWREMARLQTFVRGPRAVEAARKAAALERTLGNDDGLFWSLIPLLRSRVIEPAEFEACRAEAQALLDRHPQWPARAQVIFAGSLALEYRRRGDYATALGYQQTEAEQARRAGLEQIARNADANLAATLSGLGRYAEALALLDRSPVPAPGAEDTVDVHNGGQRFAALLGLSRLDEAEALAPEVLAKARRFDVLEIFQDMARLQSMRGRVRNAILTLGHYRQALVRLGAQVPADRDSPWREVERVATETLGAGAVQRLRERGTRLNAAEADAVMLARVDAAAEPNADPPV